MLEQDEVLIALLELAIPRHRDIEKAFEVVKLFCLQSDFLRLDEVRVDRTVCLLVRELMRQRELESNSGAGRNPGLTLL
jgi:hypothetical protein